jgi:hypothetical protein
VGLHTLLQLLLPFSKLLHFLNLLIRPVLLLGL